MQYLILMLSKLHSTEYAMHSVSANQKIFKQYDNIDHMLLKINFVRTKRSKMSVLLISTLKYDP